jgi:hypothetical protein
MYAPPWPKVDPEAEDCESVPETEVNRFWNNSGSLMNNLPEWFEHIPDWLEYADCYIELEE